MCKTIGEKLMKKYIVTVTLLVAAILLSACTPEEPKKEGTTTPPAATTQPASPTATTPAPVAKPAEPTKPAPTATKPAPTQPAVTPAPTKPAEPVAVTPAPTQPAPTSAKGSASNGAPIYKKNCAGCHGNTGAGDGPAATSLKPKPADFVTAAYKDSKGKNPREYTDAEMLDIINNGRKGTAMPAWKKQLTADQINDVLAYVRSLAK